MGRIIQGDQANSSFLRTLKALNDKRTVRNMKDRSLDVPEGTVDSYLSDLEQQGIIAPTAH
jgi:hypothetical protein